MSSNFDFIKDLNRVYFALGFFVFIFSVILFILGGVDMIDPDSFFGGIIGVGIGIFLFVAGLKLLKQKRLIENTPTSKIRSIAMGLVEIFGYVVPAEKKILKSPFSNKDCVYYRYTIEEYKKSGKNSRWVTLRSDEKFNPFYIKDDTGLVLVNPRYIIKGIKLGKFGLGTGRIDAKVDIPIDNEFRSNWGQDPPQQVKEFLTKQNISFESMFLKINKKMRYREYFIEPKEKLYVMGTAMDNPYMEEGTAIKGVEDVMIGKGKNDKIFYISDKSEKKLIKEFALKCFGLIVGGSVLLVGSLAIILFNLRLI